MYTHNHTYTETRFTNYAPAVRNNFELLTAQNLIKNMLNVKVNFFIFFYTGTKKDPNRFFCHQAPS